MLKYPKTVWKAAAEALLPGGEDVSRSDARRGHKTKTAILKALCRTDPTWRAKVREFGQKLLIAEHLDYAKKKGWGEKSDIRPATYPEPTEEKVAEIERIMYPDGVPDGFSPHSLNAGWYADREVLNA